MSVRGRRISQHLALAVVLLASGGRAGVGGGACEASITGLTAATARGMTVGRIELRAWNGKDCARNSRLALAARAMAKPKG